MGLFALPLASLALWALSSSSQRRKQASSLNLTPEEDPNARLDTLSRSGVQYGTVLDLLNTNYSPEEYSSRNALSRQDGYWAYIKVGEEPPLEATYGEFDFPFFADVLDSALHLFLEDASATTARVEDLTFIDIGSGTGRLVFGAAALHPWKKCRGVEYLQACLEFGKGIEPQVRSSFPKLAPMEWTHASIGDASIGDINVAFISSAAMPAEVLQVISDTVVAQCQTGTIIVSTDYQLPPSTGERKLQLLKQQDGYCWIVGGTSTAYFYRLV